MSESESNMKRWHSLEPGQILQGLGVSRGRGLSSEEAESRLRTYGPNALAEAPKPTLLQQFLGQFKEFLVLLLLASAAVSAVLGEVEDAAVIGAIVLLNAIIGVVQERRAEHALEALKRMAAPTARVIRDSQPATVPAASIVPGDILLLEAGDTVPADARLLESALFKVDESSLTGESVPVEKDSSALLVADVPLGDRVNCVYMGTTATYGRATAVVVATGMNTEMGKIASMLDQAPTEPTPLQVRLAALGKMLGIVAIVMVGIVSPPGCSGRADVRDVPDGGEPGRGGHPGRLAIHRHHCDGCRSSTHGGAQCHNPKPAGGGDAGSANVICSDKTGTLTTNQMTVRRLYPDSSLKVTGEGYSREGRFVMEDGTETSGVPPSVERLLTCAVLCCDARVKPVSVGSSDMELIGDPTEGAIVVAGLKAGIEQSRLEQSSPRVAEIPFDSERKRMTTVHRLPESYVCCTKGAPDEMLEVCTHVLVSGQVMPLTPSLKEEIGRTNAHLAEAALRVLGVARRELPELPADISVGSVEKGMVFLGLVGMQDPPRPEAAAAVAECREAGITPVMITGDHKNTAVAIARDIGIMTEGSIAVLGSELAQMSDEELDAEVESISVYARVAPEHKVRIVSAWRRKGKVVAMTGDGVNDAPALKAADIGAAMGKTGTDVAKSASHMILADDNFATIVAAVREGRVVFDNIKKAVFYLTSCNLGEIMVIFTAILLGLPRPLLPIQIRG